MKYVRKAATVLTLAALVCMMLTVALAAGTGSVWLEVDASDGTAALIITDTTVTDGVVKVTYDSEALTYEGVEVTESYVAMYAVNAEEPGAVLISWVAPEAYTLEEETACLIRVNFSGTEEDSSIDLTGSANDAEGDSVTVVGAPDTTALEEAIAQAESLKAEDYTEESYGDLEEALENAKAVLENLTATQEEVDAATEALLAAIEALEPVSTEPTTDTTEDTTDTAATTASTAATTKPSTGSNAATGDESNVTLFIILGLGSAAAIVVLLILMKKPKKKGRYAK